MSSITLVKDLGRIFATENSKHKCRMGIYRCECGKEFRSATSKVTIGKTQSCGCKSKRNTIHGFKNHPLYNIYQGMISRTSNPKASNYKWYGAEGISVCDEWKKDIKSFIDWSNDNGWEQGLSIDRIDPSKDYSPDNCRWVGKYIQQQNTRRINATNKSGFRGVYLHKINNKWISSINVEGVKQYLGSYNSAEEASIAYDKYVKENNLEHTTNGLIV